MQKAIIGDTVTVKNKAGYWFVVDDGFNDKGEAVYQLESDDKIIWVNESEVEL